MKSIKIIGFSIITAALLIAIIVGCEKDESSPKNDKVIEQEIQFGVTPIFSNNLKDGGGPRLDDLPECSDAVPNYAEIIVEIDGETKSFKPDVYEVDGQWYTEVFKLQVPKDDSTQVTVKQFIIFDYNDNEIQATPTSTSAYATFVDKPVGEDFTFFVGGIDKVEITIEVLCYNEKYYADFGFYWFAFEETEANELNFFGDLCTKYYMTYANEDAAGYGELVDPKVDLPAIFLVEVYDASGDLLITYNNMYMLDDDGIIDEPLAVYYPNDLDEEGDTYTLKLYIRLKVGSSFEFVEYQTIHVDGDTGNLTFPPNGDPVPDYGNDSVVDFVVGECAYYNEENEEMQPDIKFPPYMNLPETANITISHPYDDMAYWKVDVHSISPVEVFELGKGTYKGWCADADETITQATRDYQIFSSLYPDLWPECEDGHIDEGVMNKINHLFNFLENNNIEYEWEVFQLAVWKLREQTYPSHQAGVFSGFEDDADDMLDYQTWDEKYMPHPGGYAAVLLHNDCEKQLIFVQIDP
jgi:hypothetical protein